MVDGSRITRSMRRSAGIFVDSQWNLLVGCVIRCDAGEKKIRFATSQSEVTHDDYKYP
jgi:hypothetical protein